MAHPSIVAGTRDKAQWHKLKALLHCDQYSIMAAEAHVCSAGRTRLGLLSRHAINTG